MYLYITSLGSSALYPANTTAEYTNKINPSLNLAGDWVVGLVKCILPPFKNVFKADSDLFYMSLMFDDSSIENNNSEPINHLTYTPTTKIAHSNLKQLIDFIELNCRRYIILNSREWNRDLAGDNKLFYYDDIDNRVVFAPIKNILHESVLKSTKKYFWKLGPLAAKLLGCIDSIALDENRYVKSPYNPFYLTSNKNIIIYSDIVERSSMAENKVNILDVISVEPGYINKEKNHVHYKPVNSKSIDTISVTIANERGELISFEDGGCALLVLYLKQV